MTFENFDSLDEKEKLTLLLQRKTEKMVTLIKIWLMFHLLLIHFFVEGKFTKGKNTFWQVSLTELIFPSLQKSKGF